MLPLVLAITGASGSIYAVRLLQVLTAAGRDVHLVISPAAVTVFEKELGLRIDLRDFSAARLLNPEHYPDDSPYPSHLVLGWIVDRPLHVLVADNTKENEEIIITVYEPDSAAWEPGFERTHSRLVTRSGQSKVVA